MPQQVSAVDKIIFPDGVALEVSDDSGSTFYNLGVLGAGVNMTYNYDKIKVESGNAGTLKNRIKNQTIALAPSPLFNWDPTIWARFSGGAFTNTNVAGTPVAGASQVTSSGSWSYNQFIKIENQNGDGSAITVNSVTAATDGALVAATDYYVGQNERGESGIFIIDSATVTTESQNITINYDYTPSAGNIIKGGTSSLELSKVIMRLRHYTNSALSTYDMEAFVYGVDLDAGMQFNTKGANEDGVNEITVAFTGEVDISRTDGEQLFSFLVNSDAYTN